VCLVCLVHGGQNSCRASGTCVAAQSANTDAVSAGGGGGPGVRGGARGRPQRTRLPCRSPSVASSLLTCAVSLPLAVQHLADLFKQHHDKNRTSYQ
jgi:hypothetical protein